MGKGGNMAAALRAYGRLAGNKANGLLSTDGGKFQSSLGLRLTIGMKASAYDSKILVIRHQSVSIGASALLTHSRESATLHSDIWPEDSAASKDLALRRIEGLQDPKCRTRGSKSSEG
jgi:hypothetical protein